MTTTTKIKTDAGMLSREDCLARVVEIRKAVEGLRSKLEDISPSEMWDAAPDPEDDRPPGPWSEAGGAVDNAVDQLDHLEDHLQHDDGDEEHEQLAPLPDSATMEECGTIVQTLEDALSWMSEEDVRLAKSDQYRRRGLYQFLKLHDAFDGDVRIRKARASDGRINRRRLIIEDGAGGRPLPLQVADEIIFALEGEGYMEFDAASVLHVTDKGRGLFEPVVGKVGCAESD